MSADGSVSAKPLSRGRNRGGRGSSRSFWYCFAALQLSLCAAMAPLCWLVLALPSPPPLGAAPAVIVTSVGAGLCLASVGLLCGAQGATGAVCLARLLWLRIFTAGSGVCAQLAAAGLLLHAAAQLLTSAEAADRVAALAGLAAVNSGQAAAACVHIYNCVSAVQLSWRVAVDVDDEGDADGADDGGNGDGDGGNDGGGVGVEVDDDEGKTKSDDDAVELEDYA